METTKEVKMMKNVLRFQLEFMLMMQYSGRDDEATKMLRNLFETIDQVEGEYNEER